MDEDELARLYGRYVSALRSSSTQAVRCPSSLCRQRRLGARRAAGCWPRMPLNLYTPASTTHSWDSRLCCSLAAVQLVVV